MSGTRGGAAARIGVRAGAVDPAGPAAPRGPIAATRRPAPRPLSDRLPLGARTSPRPIAAALSRRRR